MDGVRNEEMRRRAGIEMESDQSIEMVGACEKN